MAASRPAATVSTNKGDTAPPIAKRVGTQCENEIAIHAKRIKECVHSLRMTMTFLRLTREKMPKMPSRAQDRRHNEGAWLSPMVKVNPLPQAATRRISDRRRLRRRT